jgi:hypothetical protein
MENYLRKHALSKKLMKLTLGQLVMLLILTGVSFAGISNAQDILDKQLTLDIKDRPLKDVLRKIETRLAVKFAYSSDAIRSIDRISISAEDEKLSDVLDKLSKLGQINYEVVAKQIILSQYFAVNEVGAALLKLEVLQEQISGTVTSETGEPIPGVNILQKGTTNGTTTKLLCPLNPLVTLSTGLTSIIP